MLQQAQDNLSRHSRLFQFMVIDAQSIPFNNHTFDIVIANHMLYHVPDQVKALAEIRRILKPSGQFYASTGGGAHLKEIHDLVTRFDPRLAEWGTLPADSFNLENGAQQLQEFFDHVRMDRYPNALLVTDAAPLTAYILSGRIELSADRQIELASYVSQALQANGGTFYVTIDAGVFEAS
jgi:SAM-dependent methyltransferase